MKLSDLVSINPNYKNAINIYLNLNKDEKINSYIPTTSSVAVLDLYLESVFSNNGKANILIGPYGKGKSHLLLILLAILSKENDKQVITNLIEKISLVDKDVANKCKKLLKSKEKFLPVIVSNSQDDLRQSFLIALNNALVRVGMSDIMPNTYFSEAIDVIKNWKKNYKQTYELFAERLKENDKSVKEFTSELENCNADALELFKRMYPGLTSGSEFNPLAGGDVLVMYKSVAEKLKEYGYSGLYIVFDEFSKYIESQSKNAVGQNMKLIQDICELADDSKDPQIFITLVTHKAIKEYGNFLPEVIINAFSGIEGRIRDIEFITSSKNNYELIKNALMVDEKKLKNVPNKTKYFGKKVIDEYYSIPVFSANYTKDDFETVVVKGCFPLNPCTAFLLLSTSEKVAQNERTLFTFISKDETNSLAQYVKKHVEGQEWQINADLIYDYFKGIFKKEISEESIHNEWLNSEYAIKKAKTEDEKNILKTLAVLNIVNKTDDMPANSINVRLSSGVLNAEEVLEELVQRKVLYLNQATGCYKFKTRAGSELKKEIQKQRVLKEERFNIPEALSRVSDIHYIMPRQYNYKFAMTRYYSYQFMLADEFLSINNLESVFEKDKHVDGLVFALFSIDGTDYTEKIREHISQSKTRNIVVIYTKKAFPLSKDLLDYEILNDIKNDVVFMTENEVLQKELSIMEEDLETGLKGYINDYLGIQHADVVLYHDGSNWICKEDYSPEKAVNISCENIYTHTLKINNELINKQYITSAPIKKARRTIIERVLKKNIDDAFENGTGPESTIYRAVLVNTGIEKADNSLETKRLLDIFTKYIDSCVENRVCLKKLTNVYYNAPFGMRAGLLPIILAFVISYRNGDIVIYHNEREVDINPDVVLDMCDNPSEYELFFSQKDQSKEDYLKELIETFDPDCYSSLTGTRISNVFTCMQRWYRSLPQVTKNLTLNNDVVGSKSIVKSLPSLKTALQRADSNAFETVFESLPRICDTEGEYKKTNERLKEIKKFLNEYFDNLLNYLIEETKVIFNDKTTNNLSHTLKDWYEKQSDSAKNSLSESNITRFMNAINEVNVYDEHDIIQKIAKAVTGIYIDSWDDSSISLYFDELKRIKTEVEKIVDETNTGKQQITISNSKGEKCHKYFEDATDPSADILKNILTDALDDFSTLSLNDRVSVLVNTLENLINKEK